MSSPVQLSDLDLATVADDADLALIRKSDTTDYKIAVQKLRDINIAGLSYLPTNVQTTDPMMIARSGTNCKILFGDIGFPAGTKLWFYASVTPTFWTIIESLGDTLLGVKKFPSGGVYNTSGSLQGTWQQDDHTLTIEEIPSHDHFSDKSLKIQGTEGDPFNNKPPTNGSGSSSTNDNQRFQTRTTGGGLGHNHGSTWRPLAAVGVICQKDATTIS